MSILRQRTGQSLTEYAILLAVVGATFLGMQLYFKRGLQAQVKGVVDHATSQAGTNLSVDVLQQYEPYYTAASDVTVTQARGSTIVVGEGYTVDTTGITETTTRAVDGTSSQEVDLTVDDFWDQTE